MEGRTLEQFLERIASGIEKLAADPQIEIEAGPPVCPTCGELDPMVMLLAQDQASGPLSQLINEVVCVKCQAPIYVVTESYSCHQSMQTARTEIEERTELDFFGTGKGGIRNG